MHSETKLHVAPDHPAFAGHFPGTPIVPGVLLLDAAVHAALQANRSSKACVEEPGGPAGMCQVSSAKFLSPVGPGETLTICLDTTAAGGVRFEISCGDREVATGTLVLPPAS
jgi:3-hydroxyacyl-[acyl-carrier-protein] dehydratase